MRSSIIGVLVPSPADAARATRAARDRFPAPRARGAGLLTPDRGQDAARDVLAALRARGHRGRAIPVDRDLDAALRRGRVELAFLALEGQGGDDGDVQAALEAAGVPHTGPAASAAALAGDRARAREVLRRSGLPIPPSYLVPAGHAADRVIERHGDLGYPVRIQPRRRASPLAACHASDPGALTAACALAGEELLVERVAPGARLRIALVGLRALGAELFHATVAASPAARAARIHQGSRPGSSRPPRAERFPAEAPAARRSAVTPSLTTMIGARRLEGILRQASAAARALDLPGSALIEIALDPETNEVVVDADPSPCLARGAPLARIAGAAGLPYEDLIAAIADAASPVAQPRAA